MDDGVLRPHLLGFFEASLQAEVQRVRLMTSPTTVGEVLSRGAGLV